MALFFYEVLCRQRFLNLFKNKYMNDQKNKQQQPQQDKDKGQGNMKEQGNMKDKDQQNMHDPSKVPHNTSHKPNMADTKREQPVGSDIENPDKENDPEKKVNIDDDPGQTKKKVPNMGK